MITSTAEALAALGIGPLTAEQRRALDQDGYFLVPDVFTPEEVAEMRAEWDRLRGIEGELGGHEVHIEPGAPGSRTCSTSRRPSTAASPAVRPWPRPTTSWARSASTR